MISNSELASLAGTTMVGQDGGKIGKIVDVYESTEGADGTFVTVSTGMFGGGASFVPLAQASLQGNDLVVPYDKELVHDAPRVEADQELTGPEEDRLYQHYGLSSGPAVGQTTGQPGTDGVDMDANDTAVGRDTSGPTTDDAMTRSEERLQVGTQEVEAGRAKLRKRIVTEQVSTTVPVTHQTATVSREPITEANMPEAMDGPALSEEEHEVTLMAETPVVAKNTVPVERVRLGVDTHTEEHTVNEQVRKEQIDVDGDTTAAGGQPSR